jgi:hypothetical protein
MTIIMVTGLQDWKDKQQQNRLYEFIFEHSTNYNIIPETISLFFYASVVTLVTLLKRRITGVKVQCTNVQPD